MLIDRNKFAVANDYARLTFKAEYTFLSNLANIQAIIDDKTRNLGNGLIVAVPASRPTVASNSILGIAYAYSVVTVRVSSAAGKRWDDLLRPLDCFGGVIVCNITLDSAELVTNLGSAGNAAATTTAQTTAAKTASTSGTNPLKSNPVTAPVLGAATTAGKIVNAIPDAAKGTATVLKFVAVGAVALAVFGIVYELAPALHLAKK